MPDLQLALASQIWITQVSRQAGCATRARRNLEMVGNHYDVAAARTESKISAMQRKSRCGLRMSGRECSLRTKTSTSQQPESTFQHRVSWLAGGSFQPCRLELKRGTQSGEPSHWCWYVAVSLHNHHAYTTRSGDAAVARFLHNMKSSVNST